jgi:sugar/nucleoside kinase (ribokinase family)
MSIAVVGSIGLDTIQTPAGRVHEVLGGSAAYFSLAARHFMPVSVVAVVGDDFPREARDLLDQPGVDLAGLEVQDGKTFRWEGVYSDDMNTRATIRTELNVFERFKPDLPDRTRSLKNVFLANIDPVLQREVLEQLDQPRLVLADTMNYWIRNKRDELLETLKRVRILIINEEEAREVTGEALTHKAARAILSLGPETVVIKQGEHGAFLQGPELFFTCPAFPIDNVIDPTGAGDSFAGGFVGYVAAQRDETIDHDLLARAMAYGTALASYNVEEFGTERVARLTADEVATRVADLQRMTRFDLAPLTLRG